MLIFNGNENKNVTRAVNLKLNRDHVKQQIGRSYLPTAGKINSVPLLLFRFR